MGLSSQFLTTAGLLLDIVGVCILFRFGLPGAMRRSVPMARNIDVVGSYGELTPQEREEDRIQMSRERRWNRRSGVAQWSALALLVVGFSLQIVAVWHDG